MEDYHLKSTADGKGGVYITKIDSKGYIVIYYCRNGKYDIIKQ